jgi:hypothetical protein
VEAGLLRKSRLSAAALHLSSWTKMRVPLALRVFNLRVVAEMTTHGQPAEKETAEFLRTVTQAFVYGLLSATPVTTSNLAERLQPIEQCVKWAEDWKAEHLKKHPGAGVNHSAFLAQITFNELIMTLTAFSMYASDFLNRCPTRYLCFRRLNQSCLESIFGWDRQMNGGSRAVLVTNHARNMGVLNHLKFEKLTPTKSQVQASDAVVHLPLAAPTKKQRLAASTSDASSSVPALRLMLSDL